MSSLFPAICSPEKHSLIEGQTLCQWDVVSHGPDIS
jgi:hypothetical protein